MPKRIIPLAALSCVVTLAACTGEDRPVERQSVEERTVEGQTVEDPTVEDPTDSGSAPAEEGWETFADSARGIAFEYPPDLGTDYIHAVDWPPQVKVEDGPFICTAAGSEIARAGRTEPVTIDGRTYCVTRVREGAAGSIYTLYAFAMPAGERVAILTFSLREVQCANYDEPARGECERERVAFSIEPIIDRIARTLRFDTRDSESLEAPAG